MLNPRPFYFGEQNSKQCCFVECLFTILFQTKRSLFLHKIYYQIIQRIYSKFVQFQHFPIICTLKASIVRENDSVSIDRFNKKPSISIPFHFTNKFLFVVSNCLINKKLLQAKWPTHFFLSPERIDTFYRLHSFYVRNILYYGGGEIISRNKFTYSVITFRPLHISDSHPQHIQIINNKRGMR